MILGQIFVFTLCAGGVMAVMTVIGTIMYDTRAVRQKRQYNRNPNGRVYRNRPLISIILPAHNDERVIERCIRALWRGSYRKFEIIVIDGASDDGTRDVVRRLQAEHPKRALRLVARRTTGVDASAIANAFKKHATGRLILRLEATDVVDDQALTNAVRYLNANPETDVLQINRRVVSAYNTAGLFQVYQELLHGRWRKFASVCRIGQKGIAIYRRDTFMKVSARVYYANDVVVYGAPVKSFYSLVKQSYGWQVSRVRGLASRKLMLPLAIASCLTALFVPILLSYFIYLAFKLHEPAYLILCGAALGLLLLLTVWGDEYLRWSQKVAYSVLMPVTYIWFLVLAFLQIFGVVGAASRRG